MFSTDSRIEPKTTTELHYADWECEQVRVEARESDDQILLFLLYYLRVVADRPLSKQRNRDESS